MLKEERYEKILEIVQDRKAVDINQLIDQVGVSRSTVRRDLLELEGTGRLTRTHGGVVSSTFGSISEPPLNMRMNANAAAKRRIAKAASELVSPDNVILLDSSTTVNFLAEEIAEVDDITVVTNDYQNVLTLMPHSNVTLISTGGMIRFGSYSHTGYFSELVMSEIHVDKLFMGVDAIDVSAGCMICNIEALRLKQLMVEAADEVIVLCDHTKFDVKAFVNVCPVGKVKRIITDDAARPEVVAALRENGVEVIVV